MQVKTHILSLLNYDTDRLKVVQSGNEDKILPVNLNLWDVIDVFKTVENLPAVYRDIRHQGN